MTKITKATEIKAVEKILALQKNGVTPTAARAVVANEFDVSVYRLNKWFKSHGPIKTTKTTRTSDNVVISQRGKDNKGLNNLSDTLFDTVEDLKEGRITHKDACAMSSLAGTITNIKKLQFAGLKYADKTSSKETTVNKLLGQ